MRLPMVIAICLGAQLLAACTTISATITEIELGDCVEATRSRRITELNHIPCETEDAYKTIKIIPLSQRFEEFPGEEELILYASRQCPTNAIWSVYPTEETWGIAEDWERIMVCFRPYS